MLRLQFWQMRPYSSSRDRSFNAYRRPGFQCKQYAGNKTNIMNSVAIVESGSKIYLVALMSNILKINSAYEHQRIADLIEKAIQGLSAR